MLASAQKTKGTVLSRPRLRSILRRLSEVSLGVFRSVLIIGISYIILFPILTKISSSFMARKDLVDQTVKWIPKNFTLDNYRMAIQTLRFPTVFRNSALLSLGVSILQLCSSTLVGYGLARFEFKGKGLVFGAAIFTLVASTDDNGSPVSQLAVL